MLWLGKKNAKENLADDKLAEFIETSPIAVARLNATGQIVEFNAAFAKLTHHTLTLDAPISLSSIVKPEQRLEVENLWSDIQFKGLQSDEPLPLELHLADGATIMVSLYMSLLKHGAEGQPSIMLHLIDTTEQKNLEMRFAHSQKMQAVGQLAGGVAHDFNNLLTAMIGFCDLLLMRHPAGDPSFADIMQVKQNANRAANLVRQVLAFSRRQTLQPKVVDLTDVLAELSNLIRRLIGENIELKMVHGREIWPVKADQGQLEQVVINLAVNARDAMKKGGMLTISPAISP
ncbi:MAG: histidine kinase dimerization/phospho-acceptor domain-containing protein [Rickettsiales bacterium]